MCDSANNWHVSDWTALFPFRDELVNYYTSFANHFDLVKCTSFGQNVQSAAWDETRNLWVIVSRNVSTNTETTWTADILIQAIGTYNRKKYPNLPEMNMFNGDAWHTADWVSLLGRIPLRHLLILTNNRCSPLSTTSRTSA